MTLAVSTGTLSNSGTIAIEKAFGGARTIEANLTNASTGKLQVNANTSFSKSGATLKNSGAITIAKGVTFSAGATQTISNETGGTITATGLLAQTSGTFNQGAGKTSGTVILDDLALNYTGTGASSLKLRGASTLSGNVAAGQLLSLESTCSENAVVTAAASFTNKGTITLTNGESCATNATLSLTGGTLENKGTINSLKASDARSAAARWSGKTARPAEPARWLFARRKYRLQRGRTFRLSRRNRFPCPRR